MATKVLMEALSPTMEEGRIASWLKQEGDTIEAGDILAEVETDKAIMELQARGHGVLRKILVPEGGTTEVGNLVAVIATEEEEIGDLLAGDGVGAGTDERGKGEEGQSDASAPLAPAAPPAGSPSPHPGEAVGGRLKASPLARKLASDRGLDLAGIAGSGPGGRIIKRDIEGAASAPPALSPPLIRSGAGGGGFQDVVPSQLRKTIARRLVQSLGPVPHFFLTTEVDMERAADARATLNALGEDRISFNDIVVKVTAAALQQHRDCNAWWMEGHIRYFDDVHIAMAVAIDDGLITPVIRNAHLKSLREIAAESRSLAERARERRLTPDEYTGGTFSISNLGMLGVDEFTAVINPPEAGILAVGAITEKPVGLDGVVALRRRMRLTMSCDHRVIDGAMGARFLQTVRRMLENPLAIVW